MKIKISVSTGLVGSRREEEVEVPDQDLEGLSQEEQEKYLDEYAQEWLWSHIDFAWSRVE
jgi:hypothetical protein